MTLKTATAIAFLTTALTLPTASQSDEAAQSENMHDSQMHEQYHEPMHVGNKAKHAKGTRAFDAADTDHDGTLTKDEAKKLPHVYQHFDEIDADHDGSVDRDEIHAYMSNKHKK
jgi:Ca2+-binding EF-hand superfamily protein